MSVPTMESTWMTLLEEVSAVSDRLDDRNPLGKVDTAVKELVFYDDRLATNEYLVHYTSWEKALAILNGSDPTIRSYNYEQTNDPQEGRLWRAAWDELATRTAHMDNLLPSHDQVLLRSGRSMGSTFGCCFSAGGLDTEDNLTFWRLYGNDGEGCSFKVTSRIAGAYRVRYLDERRRNRKDDDEELDRQVGSWLGDLLSRGRKLVDQSLSERHKSLSERRKSVANGMAERIRKVLGGYNHLAKSSYFEDEKEWRMIDVAPPIDSIKYDVDEAGVVRRYVGRLALEYCLATGSSITVGPQVPNGGAARAYVEHLARKKGLDLPEVNLSKQTYRSAR